MLEHSEPQAITKDKYHLSFILFYALGTSIVIPTNFITTATDYWMYKFRDPNSQNETFDSEHRTGLQAQFISWYSIVSHVSNIFFLVFCMVVLRNVSMIKCIIGALGGILSMFAITCFFIPINTDTWQRGFFVVTLIIGLVLTGFCAAFMVTVFKMVAKFPPKYLAALLSGQAICGIFAALVQIFSLSIGASSKNSGLTYFGIGMFFVFLTLIGFLVNVYRSEFFKHHLGKEAEKTVKAKITKAMFWDVLNKVKLYLISMILVLGCSIMIHPGVTSLIISVDKGNGILWNDVYFVPVTTFLLYFVFDYAGREFAGFLNKPQNEIVIFIASICRIGLAPMIMFCNAQPRSHLPVVFDKDFIYVILIIVFAFTHGYLLNLCVIQIATVIADEEKKLAIFLVLVFMIVSLGACSFLSALVIKLL